MPCCSEWRTSVSCAHCAPPPPPCRSPCAWAAPPSSPTACCCGSTRHGPRGGGSSSVAEPPEVVMRVLHVTPYFAPAFRYGGPPRSILGLCRGLARAGAAVEVLTTTADGPFDLPASPPDGDVWDGVAVRYLPRAFPRRLFGARGLGAGLDAAVSPADGGPVHGP